MRLPWKAAATSAGLSALFVVVYSSCNVITSRRAGVGSIYFAWERGIPFLPSLILPYMSIDLFFIAAPFLARSDRERVTLAKRIIAAILVAGACFLLFPLRFAFDRPHVEGLLGAIFNNFRTLDLPFNEFPSLHIALWVILSDMYHRHSKGAVRVGLMAWFALIAISPLVTYQHHVVDVVGGFFLGVLCLHFVREGAVRQRGSGNRRVAAYYGGGAGLLVALALAGAPWRWLLLWPAGSLAMVAGGYLFLGAGVFGKERGRLSWTTWVLLWPVLLGHRASLAFYARGCRPYDRLTDRLWIGRRLSKAEARELGAQGMVAVVDLAGEFSECSEWRGRAYLQLSILDLTAPTREQIRQAVEFMREQTARGGVYLHCKIGYSRTAAVAGAYLLATERAGTVEEAIAALRRARPGIVVRPEAEGALRRYREECHGGAAAPVPV